MSNNPIRILQNQKISEQQIQNFSFDYDFDMLMVEIAGYDAVSDSLKRISVDGLGQLKVVVGGTSSSIWEWDEVNTVAANAIATILTHTVTTSDLLLDNIIATGTVDAEYQVLLDGNIKAKYMTSEQDRTAKFLMPTAQRITVGTVITVKAIHFRTGVIADFNASLIGHK